MTDNTQDTAAADAEAKAAADAAAAKAAAEKAVTPVVPESYTFTMPDGTKLDPKATERITEKAKALKVADMSLAQAFVDVAHTEVEAFRAAYEAAHKEDGVAWKAAVEANEAAALAHPDLGNGDPTRLQDIALRGALVLNRYAPDAAPKLKAAGLLNEPSVLLMLKRIDEATREKPSPVSNGGVHADLPWEKQMYPDGIKVST